MNRSVLCKRGKYHYHFMGREQTNKSQSAYPNKSSSKLVAELVREYRPSESFILKLV